MPSTIPQIDESSAKLVVSARPRRGLTLQNLSPVNIYVRWDGNPNVTASNNSPDSGIRLVPGALLDLAGDWESSRNANNAVYAISEPGSGSGNELRYIVR